MQAVEKTAAGKPVVNTIPIAVTAVDEGEAKGKAYRTCLEVYDPEKGFEKHCVGLVSVQIYQGPGGLIVVSGK
jgi:hypothetical protein